VERLEPGHTEAEFEERRRRLLIFQEHGGRVMHGVPYVQPDLQNRSTPKRMHLVYFSLTGRTALPSTEVRRLLVFMYRKWYGDPFRGKPDVQKYLRRLARRRFIIPPFSVPLVEPVNQEMTRMPKAWWRGYLLPAAAASIAAVYEMTPMKEAMDGWIRAGGNVLGAGVAFAALVAGLTVVQVLLTKDTPV
jgi:hypothetical protein